MITLWSCHGRNVFVIAAEHKQIPCGSWTEHAFRTLIDECDGFLHGKRYLIHDRDPLFTASLENLLRDASIKPIRLPPRSPNLNAYAERFVRSIKEECLNRMIILGERRLRYVIDEYVEHFHLERPPQGIGSVLIQPSEASQCVDNPHSRRDRLGGLLRSFHRTAA